MSDKENVLWTLRQHSLISQLKEGKRSDGRKPDETRKIHIQKEGVSENAHGIARVKLGSTDVIAGVKMDVATPYPDSPDEGSITVGAELLALASPDFEVGPPREEAIELSRVVDRGIRESGAIDFKSLSIVSGEKCWMVIIDIYILNQDGNLFDAASIAAVSALLDTKIPKLDGENKIVKGEFAGRLKLSKKPVMSTFAKIGNTVVLDPDMEEETAAAARFSIGIADDDHISAFQKGGSGSFTPEEVNNCIETAFKNAKHIRKVL